MATEWEALARRLSDRIRDGEWAPGDELPTSKELQASEGVSENTVTRALAHLASRGVIEGRGTRRKRVVAVPAETLMTVEEQLAVLQARVDNHERRLADGGL